MEIVLGVTGGIAAYKAAEIVRGLLREGAGVTVVMTEHAREFVTPLTLQTLSGRRVLTGQFDAASRATDPRDVEHIGLAGSCDLMLVAPATANVLAKMAAGIADDFLTTFHLAVTCPVAVAPAMNSRMWGHPATVANLERLVARGVHVIGPDTGPMASRGEEPGPGRLAPPETIVARALEIARGGSARPDAPRGALAGKRILVTAGPTREELDPVRFISNPSTGRMGYAVAAAARDLGAEVTLVSGPTHLDSPAGVPTVRVESAEQMRSAVMAALDGGAAVDAVIMAAAVSDFRPATRAPRKVRKTGAPERLVLEPTPDILAEIGARRRRPFLVGFAAETDDLVASAKAKLDRKRLDLIVANSVARQDGGGAFGSQTNEVVILDSRGRPARWPRMSKTEVAARLMALVAERIA